MLFVSLGVNLLAAAFGLASTQNAVDAHRSAPKTPYTTLVQAAPGENVYFPGVTRLASGRLLLVYREGIGHVGADGRIVQVVSADDGRNWSSPRVIIDTPDDDRDPKVSELRDGSLQLLFFSSSGAAPNEITNAYACTSQDGGDTWSAPLTVNTAMAHPTGQRDDAGSLLGWSANHGAIVELPNGDLLAPLYGTLVDNPWQRATVVRSTDVGHTWPAATEVVVAARDGLHFQEPVLCLLQSGHLIAVLRSDSESVYFSRSIDGGLTWSVPDSLPIRASSQHVLALADGRLLFTYGDRSDSFAPGRPTVGFIVTDPEVSLMGGKQLFLYDAGYPDQTVYDQGYPWSVELASGGFLTVDYDTVRHRLVGTTSLPSEYE